MTTTTNSLERRALAAYFRDTSSVDQPSGDPERHTVGGKEYIRLSNIRGTLAVYRVLNNGNLKRLKRWPVEIDGGES